jgi:hypothetical protein
MDGTIIGLKKKGNIGKCICQHYHGHITHKHPNCPVHNNIHFHKKPCEQHSKSECGCFYDYWYIFLGLALLILGAVILIFTQGIYLDDDDSIHHYDDDGKNKHDCPDVYHRYSHQSYDGTGNTANKDNGEEYGKVGETFPRYLPNEYSDNKGQPAGYSRPNPRHISNYLCEQDDGDDDGDDDSGYKYIDDDDNNSHWNNDDDSSKSSDEDDDFHIKQVDDDLFILHLDDEDDDHAPKKDKHQRYWLSSITWLWGQFIDHTITLGDLDHTDFMQYNITGDPVYDPHNNGRMMMIPRTVHREDHYGVRQQFNSLSSYIDSSSVYGVKDQRLHRIRKYEYGKVWLSDDDHMPPINQWGLDNQPVNTDDFYLFGDIRGNEHIGLIALHTLWLREHNYWAEHYYHKYPTWTDEKLFQMARKRVIAEIQSITYNEFLPSLLGEKIKIECYNEYDPVDPRIYNEFNTGAYRFGHSMVNEDIHSRNTHDGKMKRIYNLKDVFFTPEHYKNKSVSVDEILLGFIKQKANKIDVKVVDSMRNAEVHGQPFDLVSLNVARGRDHGLPNYMKMRNHFGGEPVYDWYDITKNKKVVHKLSNLYGNNGWNDVDLYIGVISEDKYPKSHFGYTLHHIIKDQFKRLMSGDSYFYLWDSDLTYDKDDIHKTTLKDVILRNTNINDYHVKDNVFYFHKH